MNNAISTEERSKEINKVSMISIFINVFLSVFKLLAGIFANSSAMISDSVHSFSDVFSTIVVLFGAKISSKEQDKDHNYGHEKYESVAGMVLSAILFLTAIWICKSGFEKIILSTNGELQKPGVLALVAAFVSIALKELMYRITIKVAKKIKSTALKADAWHHRSDAFSSIGSMVGIGGAMLGFSILDPIASILIGFLIIKVAYEIFMEAIDQVTDKAAPDEFYLELKEYIINSDGVIYIDMLKTRIHGTKIYVDLDIVVDKNLTLENAHSISEKIHDEIEAKFQDVKHCMVHVNPSKNKKVVKNRIS